MLRGVVLCETSRLSPALEKFAEFGMVHSKELREKRSGESSMQSPRFAFGVEKIPGRENLQPINRLSEERTKIPAVERE